MKRQIYILILIFFLQSCQERTENLTRFTSIEITQKNNSTNTDKLDTANIEIKEEKQILTINRDSLNKFLNNPFNLYRFKKEKRMSNSGGGKTEKYYFRPNKNGMYYRYFLFSRGRGYIGTNKNRIIRKIDGLVITVFKELGKYQYDFIDPTEELIEVRAEYNDFDLPELALVGLDSTAIIERFGKPDLYRMNSLVYEYNNKVLILNIKRRRVKWLKYINKKRGVDIMKTDEIFEI